jgi:hypothetical protein
MPDRETLQRWLAEQEDFREQYHFLLQIQAEELLAEAYAIADTAMSGCLEQVRGSKVVTLAGRLELACARLRLHVRWWVADQLIATIRRQSPLSSSERHLRRLRRRRLRRDRRSPARRPQCH